MWRPDLRCFIWLFCDKPIHVEQKLLFLCKISGVLFLVFFHSKLNLTKPLQISAYDCRILLICKYWFLSEFCLRYN